MTTTRKTIRSNATKMIAAIFAETTAVRIYDLQSCFVGVEGTAERAREMYESMRASGCKPRFTYVRDGKLLRDGTRRPAFYSIRIHSNLWYELEAPAPEMLGKGKREKDNAQVALMQWLGAVA